ncbi:hypothetical protein [Desulfoglaeba alkanexedens]|jgi:hypothetical protein|uniref:Uncharacterized protein n=1 Tax=Desulfoglaeba alkanexedens ALDC TaxID=980445 RepID=A0A4P8L4V1_9BACT|nr:hypothetical protein [Desulfoglaeba alkanexedens]QCQ21802.1 hypothetical protein FDQ92_06165 [Desulfoglaeba alkanexedens ALDC]
MAREYRPNIKEMSVISKLDQAKEAQKTRALQLLREHLDELTNRIAIKLVEKRLVETTSKDELEAQINRCLETLLNADEFEIQFAVANVRDVVPRPHFVSLYLTAFILEKLIDHRCIVDIYGTDQEIYACVNDQVYRWIPLQ